MERQEAVKLLSRIARDLAFEGGWPDGQPDCIMAPIRNERDAALMLAGLDQQFGDRIGPDSLSGVGYLVDLRETDSVRPIYILGTLYALLVADAHIYLSQKLLSGEGFPDWHAEFGSTFSHIWNPLVKSYPNVSIVEVPKDIDECDVYEEFALEHPDIRRVILLGDFVNSLHAMYAYRQAGLSVSMPTALLIVADYSRRNAHNADMAVIKRVGELDFWYRYDYWAFRAPDNQDDLVGDGGAIEYADLFWDVCDVVESIYELHLFDDALLTIVLTDREREELCCLGSCHARCRVVLSKEFRLSDMCYDFASLVE